MTSKVTEHNATIARNIRFLRTEKKLSLDDLADLACIPNSIILDIETEQYQEGINHEYIQKISHALEVSVGVLTGVGDEFNARMSDLEARVRDHHYSVEDVAFANEILKETRHRGPEDHYKALHLRGVLSFLRGEYQAALMYYQAAVDHAERCDISQKSLWKLKRNRIEALLQLGRYEELLTLGHQLLDQIDDEATRARVHYTLGVSYHNLGLYDSAVSHINQAIANLLESVQDGILLSRCYVVLGLIFRRLRKPSHAIKNSELALDIAKKSGDELGQVYALLVLGEIELDREDIIAAKVFFQVALEVAERNENRKIEQILLLFALTRCEDSTARMYEAMSEVLNRVEIEKIELSPRDLAEMHEIAAKEAFTVGKYASGQRHLDAVIRSLKANSGKGNEDSMSNTR